MAGVAAAALPLRPGVGGGWMMARFAMDGEGDDDAVTVDEAPAMPVVGVAPAVATPFVWMGPGGTTGRFSFGIDGAGMGVTVIGATGAIAMIAAPREQRSAGCDGLHPPPVYRDSERTESVADESTVSR